MLRFFLSSFLAGREAIGGRGGIREGSQKVERLILGRRMINVPYSKKKRDKEVNI